MVISVKENKIVQEIIFEGIKKSEIINTLKENIYSKEKNPYVVNNSKIDLNIIKSILKNSGFYFAEINQKIIENNNDTINLLYEINLGDKAYIKKLILQISIIKIEH